MGEWLSIKTILALISNVAGFLRGLMNYISTQEAKQAGRDEAAAEAAQQKAERVAEAKRVGEEAEKEHNKKTDDSAFDPDYWRD